MFTDAEKSRGSVQWEEWRGVLVDALSLVGTTMGLAGATRDAKDSIWVAEP